MNPSELYQLIAEKKLLTLDELAEFRKNDHPWHADIMLKQIIKNTRSARDQRSYGSPALHAMLVPNSKIFPHQWQTL